MRVYKERNRQRACRQAGIGLVWTATSKWNYKMIYEKFDYTYFVSGATVLLLAGCDVKDRFKHSASRQRQITLTTDWTRRTTGVDIPANYTVASGEYMATVSDATNTLDRLFEPGVCHLRVYNTPEHITVSGSVATVAGAR